MAVRVVDASAIASILLNEPEAADVLRVIQECELVAPHLIDV